MPSTLFRVTAVVLALLSFVASATVVVYETIDDMARRVPVIVRGKVTRSVAGWDDHKRRIWTWTEVMVSESIKGKTGAVVLVKQPGGEVDGIGQAVAGTARFVEGEDCVLFLEPAPDEPTTFRTTGLSAGKVLIADWRGQSAALRNTDGISFAAPTGKKVELVRSPEFLGAPADFIARVRAAQGGAQ